MVLPGLAVSLVLPGFAVFSGVAWISLVLPGVAVCLVLLSHCRSPSTCSGCVVRCSTGASVSGVSKCVAGLMGEVRQCLIILSM